MDNKRIDVTSEGQDDFEAVLRLCGSDSVCGWREESVESPHSKTLTSHLILYWGHPYDSVAGYNRLPYDMSPKRAADFAWGWLENHPYPEEPDHDGSNGKGWRVYSGSMDEIPKHEVFAVIEPVWACYGK